MIPSNAKGQRIIYRQSSVVPFRLRNNDIELLLITSLKSQKWIFPKGIIEENLSAQESAHQEAYEEAGVQGRISDMIIGTYTYQKWGGVCQVTVFPMIVNKIFDKWPEALYRKRMWISVNSSFQYIESSDLKKIVRFFIKERLKIYSSLEISVSV